MAIQTVTQLSSLTSTDIGRALTNAYVEISFKKGSTYASYKMTLDELIQLIMNDTRLASKLNKYVTIDGAQTITGVKTFSTKANLSAANVYALSATNLSATNLSATKLSATNLSCKNDMHGCALSAKWN